MLKSHSNAWHDHAQYISNWYLSPDKKMFVNSKGMLCLAHVLPNSPASWKAFCFQEVVRTSAALNRLSHLLPLSSCCRKEPSFSSFSWIVSAENYLSTFTAFTVSFLFALRRRNWKLPSSAMNMPSYIHSSVSRGLMKIITMVVLYQHVFLSFSMLLTSGQAGQPSSCSCNNGILPLAAANKPFMISSISMYAKKASFNAFRIVSVF